jgi:xanthine dehydrogenase molybdopterin-binding subunit B
VTVAAKMGVDLVAFSKFTLPPWFDNLFATHDFLYFTWNAAVTEAEVDLLTGDRQYLDPLVFLFII